MVRVERGQLDNQSSDDLALREIRHRLANSFQLINSFIRLRAGRTGSEEARRELEQVATMITTLGALQERLSQPVGGDFAGFLEETGESWARLATASEVRVDVRAEPVELPGRAASPLALIAHELVTNALEHAFPEGGSGTVTVTLGQCDGEIELAVTDDGRGFDAAHAEPVDPQSLGLTLVRNLAAQLGGRFEVAVGEGTRAAVKIPVDHAQ